MPPAHLALALLVVAIWGLAFVATRLALDTISPPLLTALRFAVAALPAALLPRPPIGARTLLLIGLTLYTGQFLFQFFGIAAGMPPGLAAIVVQTQALFTIVLAAVTAGERPGRREWTGTAVAFAGLAVIAATVGDDLTVAGLALTGLSALSWGVGNVLVKRLPSVDPLGLAVWLSLVPPAPALALAAALGGRGPLAAWRAASWVAIGAVLYLGLVATVLAYAIWGYLLRRHPAARVAPFALLVPFVAAAASALVLGERFGAPRLLGMALVLAGLAIIVRGAAEVTEPAAGSR
ncbi:MAG TPA: EamA family transporter [Methylomirabilota bacterium]|nr:EamA family transporter [Methylomirabilota bacterium]